MTMPAEREGHLDRRLPRLVGREREQALLGERLATTLAGAGGLVLIGGEAGIGKTALAEALAREAVEQGALALVGRCYDLSETPPYGPWVELFERLPAEHHRSTLPAPLGDGEAPTSQAALFARLRDYLAALAACQPLVLLLDDLHWADPASVDLLRSLARQVTALPLLLVVTYRVEDVTRRHPLYQLMPALVHDAPVVRLALHALDHDAVLGLVAARYPLPAADTARLATYLQQHAEGNPFYIRELLQALEEEGLLRPGTAGWALGDLTRVRVPPFLRQVIEGRLARLGEAAQRLLTVAAVIGHDVPLDVWAAVGDAEEEALVDVIERAVEARVLEETAGGVRFAHALIREALYEGTLGPRRRAWHRRVGDAVLARPNPDPDAVAYHFQQAGDPRAAEWLIAAGERAQRAYAWLSAAERYEAAVALLEGRQDQVRQRALLLMTLAQLHRYEQPERGLARLEEAARLAAAAGDQALAAAARFDHGHLLCLAKRDMQRGLAAMASTLPLLEALPAGERAGLPALVVQGVGPEERYHRGALVNWLQQSGRYGEALRYGAPFARREPGTPARGLAGLGMAYAVLGRPAEARQALRDARAAWLAAGQHHEVGQMCGSELDYIVLPYETERRAEQAWLRAEAARAFARARGTMGDSRASVLDLSLALPHLWLEGRWAEARRRAAASPAAASSWLTLALTLARIARAQGEAEEAWRLVRAGLPAGPASEPGLAPFALLFPFQRLGATLALDAGDLAGARAWLAAHDRWLAWGGAVRWQAEGQLGWAAYHRAAGDRALARAHAERALAHATGPRQPLALLAAHRLLGELATLAGRHAVAAAHLAQALALADACAVPYERALTLLATAELRAAAGDRREAQALLDEARTICTSLGAAPALARADALATRLPLLKLPRPTYPAGLTAREVEVLRLVAAGKSNQAIGTALSLSARTVERHITHIYRKIDARSKADATAFAFRHHLT